MPSSEHFTDTELRCKCCGANEIKEPFLAMLEKLRARVGSPLAIRSGYRCSKHNAEVSKSGPNGPHTTGLAVDIAAPTAAEGFLIQKYAYELGFTGVGAKLHGDAGGRFVHVDIILGVPHIPRPAAWSYA